MTDQILNRSDIAPWTLINIRAAERQGWNVFNSGGSRARIERDEERDTFEGDADAWTFVAQGAASGKELCRRALLHVALNNQHEWLKIQKHLEGIAL